MKRDRLEWQTNAVKRLILVNVTYFTFLVLTIVFDCDSKNARVACTI